MMKSYTKIGWQSWCRDILFFEKSLERTYNKLCLNMAKYFLLRPMCASLGYNYVTLSRLPPNFGINLHHSSCRFLFHVTCVLKIGRFGFPNELISSHQLAIFHSHEAVATMHKACCAFRPRTSPESAWMQMYFSPPSLIPFELK